MIKIVDEIMEYFRENSPDVLDKAFKKYKKRFGYLEKDGLKLPEEDFSYYFITEYKIRGKIAGQVFEENNKLNRDQKIEIRMLKSVFFGSFKIISKEGNSFRLKDLFDDEIYFVKALMLDGNLKQGSTIMTRLMHSKFGNYYMFVGMIIPLPDGINLFGMEIGEKGIEKFSKNVPIDLVFEMNRLVIIYGNEDIKRLNLEMNKFRKFYNDKMERICGHFGKGAGDVFKEVNSLIRNNKKREALEMVEEMLKIYPESLEVEDLKKQCNK